MAAPPAPGPRLARTRDGPPAPRSRQGQRRQHGPRQRGHVPQPAPLGKRRRRCLRTLPTALLRSIGPITRPVRPWPAAGDSRRPRPACAAAGYPGDETVTRMEQLTVRRSAAAAECAEAAAALARALAASCEPAALAREEEPWGWTAPGILEALIPGRMQSHACTAEVPR